MYSFSVIDTLLYCIKGSVMQYFRNKVTTYLQALEFEAFWVRIFNFSLATINFNREILLFLILFQDVWKHYWYRIYQLLRKPY